LSPEAWDLIVDFQHRQAAKIPSISNAATATVLNKAGMHCARLALNLHVIKYATLSNFDSQRTVIPDHTMIEAIELTEWFINEACRLYAMFDGSDPPDDCEAMKVKAKISRLGGKATSRELHSGIAFFRNMNADDVKNQLNGMVDAGILSVHTETAKNGRVVEYYVINASTLNVINTVSEVNNLGGAGMEDTIDCHGDMDSENDVEALSVDCVDNVDTNDT
jgi:hypothetical protein